MGLSKKRILPNIIKLRFILNLFSIIIMPVILGIIFGSIIAIFIDGDFKKYIAYASGIIFVLAIIYVILRKPTTV